MQALSLSHILQKINNDKFLVKYPPEFKQAYFFFLVVMNTGGIVWGFLCIIFGFYLTSIIPFGYFFFSLFNLWYLFKSENFVITRFMQVLFSMLLPFLFQWLLGGFIATGVVMLWSVLTLIAVLTFIKSSRGIGWMIFFVILLIGSTLADSYLTNFTPESLKSPQVQRILLTINIGMIGVITFFLSRFFINSDRRTKGLNHMLEEQKNELSERNFEIEQQNEEIQAINDELHQFTNDIKKKNAAILGSINYAKNIQKALHSSSSDLQNLLPQSFVLNRPKDIVSGDFFWFDKTEASPVYEEKETFQGIERVFVDFEQEKIIIAAVDCTGHGVPGAFMTVMGKVFLDEIVTHNNVSNPANILNELDAKIITSLSKSNDKKSMNDGMDMAVMALNMEDKTLTYAGAKNPLWYVRDGKMLEIKGSKYPIGSSQYSKQKEFKNTTIDILPGDMYYLFSDGFQDQFGGEQDTKYLKKRFRELLLSIHRLPLDQQKQILQEELNNWKQNKPQTDDVLIVGIKM